jgi:outer membrane lipoprotein SlyB
MARLSAIRNGGFACLALAGVFGLSACATDPGPYAYNRYEAGTIARVEEGVVVAVRPVVFDGQQPGSGAAIGGLAGVAVGSQFGGDTGGHIAGAVIGGILGAVAGDAIANNSQQQGYAYTIRRERDGSMVEIAQVEPQPFPVGARVHITYGDRVRVVPAGYGY